MIIALAFVALAVAGYLYVRNHKAQTAAALSKLTVDVSVAKAKAAADLAEIKAKL